MTTCAAPVFFSKRSTSEVRCGIIPFFANLANCHLHIADSKTLSFPSGSFWETKATTVPKSHPCVAAAAAPKAVEGEKPFLFKTIPPLHFRQLRHPTPFPPPC